MADTAKDIVIVGAGVLGLSTAIAISENLTTPHKLTIIAEHLPEDFIYSTEYTSPWAGAHFRPFPSKNEHELREYKLTRITQQYFQKLARTSPESSIKFIKAIEYLEDPDQLYSNLTEGYTEDITNFKVLDEDELPHGVKLGTSYDTWVLNSPLYIQYLQRRLRFEYEVTFIKAKLKSLKEVNNLIPNYPIIVNCSGKGLQYNEGYDSNMYPIRGQTLLINPPLNHSLEDLTITRQSKDGQWTFCIPRPLHGGLILGGTKQAYDTCNRVKTDDTKALIERGSKLFPELMKTNKNGEKYFDIVRINVGFRPARKNGLNLSIDKTNDNVIINNYGAGGMGYELSYGSGFKVYQLLNEHLQSKSKL